MSTAEARRTVRQKLTQLKRVANGGYYLCWVVAVIGLANSSQVPAMGGVALVAIIIGLLLGGYLYLGIRCPRCNHPFGGALGWNPIWLPSGLLYCPNCRLNLDTVVRTDDSSI